MANKILRLDITKIPDLTPIIYGRVQDGLVQTVDVYVTNNGEPFDLTGWVTKFEGNTSGNRTYVQDLDNVVMVDRTKGFFTYTFPLTAFAVAGKYEHAYFSFTKGEQRETTSDFNIQVFENADITAEEAHSVIREYDKLVEELNRIFLEAQTNLQDDYDDFKAEYDAKYNAYITDLTNKIKEAQNKIDILNSNYQVADAKIKDLEQRLSDLVNNGLLKMEDVLKFLGGQDVSMKIAIDFTGKISGSTVENPNILRFNSALKSVINNTSIPNSGTELLSDNEPANMWKNYANAAALDGQYAQSQHTTADRISYHVATLDIVEELGRRFPNIYKAAGADTMAKKIAVVKQKGINAVGRAWGFATTGDVYGYSIGRSTFNTNGTFKQWGGLFSTGSNTHTASTPNQVFANTTLETMISNEGKSYYIMAAVEPSDGVKLNKVNLDYFRCDITLKLNISDFIDLSKYYTKTEIENQVQFWKVFKNDGNAFRSSDFATKPLSFHDLRTYKRTVFFSKSEALLLTDYTDVPEETRNDGGLTGYVIQNIPDLDNASSIQVLMSTTTSTSTHVAWRRVTAASKPVFKRAANVDEVVKLTGNQNIVGLKNFTGTLQYNGTEVAKVGASYTKAESDNKFLLKTASERSLLTIKQSIITVEDWNTITTPGIFYVNGGTGENKPTTDAANGFLFVKNANIIILTQEFDDGINKYIRQKGSDGWSPWKKVAFTNEIVNLTDNQVIAGVKDFSSIPTINSIPIAQEKLGFTLSDGGLDGVDRADGTTLKWGRIVGYDNQYTKDHFDEFFELSEDQKTLTIKQNLRLQFHGNFSSQTGNGSYYSYLGIRQNGGSDKRVCGIAGTVNWRNDVGWHTIIDFKAGVKVTAVLGTNYVVEKANHFGIDFCHISTVVIP